MSEECCNCKFWKRGSSYVGWCHRNPPVVFLKNEYGTRTEWPDVKKNDWCGEWKPLPPANIREAVEQARAGHVEPES